MTAPTPQRAASAEKREARSQESRIQAAADAGIAPTIHKLGARIRQLDAENSALTARITAAEARAALAENTVGIRKAEADAHEVAMQAVVDARRAAEARAEEAEATLKQDREMWEIDKWVADMGTRAEASEKNLIALARMYGEVCRNYACFRVEADEMWGSLKSVGASMLRHKADRDRLADEVARLRGALKPFADHAEWAERVEWPRSVAEDPMTPVLGRNGEYGEVLGEVTVGDFQAARRALTATGGPTDGQA